MADNTSEIGEDNQVNNGDKLEANVEDSVANSRDDVAQNVKEIPPEPDATVDSKAEVTKTTEHDSLDPANNKTEAVEANKFDEKDDNGVEEEVKTETKENPNMEQPHAPHEGVTEDGPHENEPVPDPLDNEENQQQIVLPSTADDEAHNSDITDANAEMPAVADEGTSRPITDDSIAHSEPINDDHGVPLGDSEDEADDYHVLQPESPKIPTPPPLPPQPSDKDQLVSQQSTAESTGGTDFVSDSSLAALNLVWSFGFNSDVPVLNLSNQHQHVALYVCAHTPVLYDFENNRQKVLQGHVQNIVCTTCSRDKRWLATACAGDESIIIIWDTFRCIPVRTIFKPHPGGCSAITLTPDAKFLATLGVKTKSEQQVFAIWNWLSSIDTPVCCVSLDDSFGNQNYICFDPNNINHIVSNSETQVLFYEWDGSADIKVLAPPLTYDNFNKPVGKFSQSIFVPDSPLALTATSIGILVVWDNREQGSNIQSTISSPLDKRALKLLELQPKIGFTVLDVADNYIVTGDIRGHVKFFNRNLQLVFWYSDLNLGPVNAISFQYLPIFDKNLPEGHKYPESATVDREPFVARPFLVGSSDATIISVDPNGPKLSLTHRDHDAAIKAVVTHPTKPWLAIGSYSGLLKTWDYESRVTLKSRYFEKGTLINACTFDPAGAILAIGFVNGVVQLLDATSLEGDEEDSFVYTRASITHIVFSQDSVFMATADESFATSLFCRLNEKWNYIARYRAHYKPIHDITFGVEVDTNKPRLLSLGADRLLVEYDLMNSSKDDLRILSTDRIEQSGVPLCLAWYPPITKETFVVTGNDQFKLKLFNATTKMCRKTLLGPTYGSPLKRILVLPTLEPLVDEVDTRTRYLAFCNSTHVGLTLLPLDGNCYNTVTSVAHPGGVDTVCSSFDGKFLFTSGGPDRTVHMWKLNLSALHANSKVGGEGLVPFYSMLEGGREGQLFRDMEDYFYYSMIRSQGIDTMESREIAKEIPLSEMPYVLRALGYYPTEQEIENMTNEVKFSEYVETGKYKESIDIEDFLKLLIEVFINHRPAFGLELDKITWALRVLGAASVTSIDASLRPYVDRGDFLDILQSQGEHMTEYELAEYLTVLLGQAPEGGSLELALFVIAESSSSVTVVAHGIVGGIPVPFKIPQSDACKLGVKCPVKPGTTYEYKQSFPILSSYPPNIDAAKVGSILDENLPQHIDADFFTEGLLGMETQNSSLVQENDSTILASATE